MSSIKSAVTKTIEPLRNQGGKLINNTNFISHILRNYKDVTDSYMDVLMGSISHMPDALSRQIKLSLLSKISDEYGRILESMQKHYSVGAEIAKIINSTQDFKEIEETEPYAIYRHVHQHTYVQLAEARDGVKKKFQPLDQRRFIPSYDPKHLISVIDSLSYSPAFIERAMANFGVDGPKMNKKKDDIKKMIDRFKTMLPQTLSLGLHGVDLLDLINRLDSHELSEASRLQFDPEFATFFVNKSLPVLPACSAGNEVSMTKHDAEDGRFNSTACLEGAWLQVGSDMETEDLVDVDSFMSVPTLRNALEVLICSAAGLHSKNVRPGIRYEQVTLPIQNNALFPFMNDILRQGYKALVVDERLQFFSELHKMASRGENSRPLPYTQLHENLEQAMSADTLTIQNFGRDLMREHIYAQLPDIKKKHIDRTGTKQNVVKVFDENNHFTCSSSQVESNLDMIKISSDSPIFQMESLPLSSSIFSSEAILLKSLIMTDVTVDSVKGSEIIDLLTHLHDLDQKALRNDMMLEYGMRDIETRIMNDVGKSCFDYTSPSSLEFFSIRELAQKYAMTAPSGEITLWEETKVAPAIVSIGRSQVMTQREISAVRLRDSSFTIGTYKGQFVKESEEAEAAGLASLWKDIFKTYFFESFPKVVKDLEYKRTFENIEYYKRNTQLNEYFTKYQLSQSTSNLLNHRLTKAHLTGGLDKEVLFNISNSDVLIRKEVLEDIRTFAIQLVDHVVVNFKKDSEVIKTISKFLSSTMTVADEHHFASNNVTNFFDLLLSIMFKNARGRHTALVIVYVQEIITALSTHKIVK